MSEAMTQTEKTKSKASLAKLAENAKKGQRI